MSKKHKKALSASLKALVATAATIGANVANGYADAVDLFRKVAKSREALQLASANYKHGYVARYLSDTYAKRWDNLSPEQRADEAREIYTRPYPESSKPNRRTEAEHRACRAADVSLATAKRRAGILATKKGGRKPQPARKATSSRAVPVDLVKASPRLASKDAANDYFATACAALLATVNKNAKNIEPRLSTAVSDFHSALKSIGLIK